MTIRNVSETLVLSSSTNTGRECGRVISFRVSSRRGAATTSTLASRDNTDNTATRRRKRPEKVNISSHMTHG